MIPANYTKPNLKEVVSKIKHLNEEQKKILRTTLLENQEAFQGTKGHWIGKDIDIELKGDAKPYFARPYNIPKSQVKLMKEEIDRLVKINVLTFLMPYKNAFTTEHF